VKNFAEQISIKFRGFYVIKMKLVQTVLYGQARHISMEIRLSADI